jgi:flagellar assembly factor FliW
VRARAGLAASAEVDQSRVITIDAGLPGFPAARHFVLVRWGGEDSPFSLLQCVDVDDLQFVVVPPEIFFPDYRASVDEEDAGRLHLDNADDALVLVILTLGDSPRDATANLLGPIVINRHTLEAAQVVLASAEYDVRTPVAAR